MADFALTVSSTPICNCLGRGAFVQPVAAQLGEAATRRKWPRHGADSATLTATPIAASVHLSTAVDGAARARPA
jgi:hypothetical protein